MIFINTDNFNRLNILCIIISFCTWTPQIIHNIVYNNRIIYPFYYLITCSIDKIIFINYLHEGHRKKQTVLVLYIVLIYILLTIIILYLQNFLGPRFMLPLKYKKKESFLYKSLNELLIEKPEARNGECSICLLPFIEKKD